MAVTTAPPTKQDYERPCREHLADFREFLTALPVERWDESTLCGGWTVRNVVAHLTAGRTIPVAKVLAKVAAGGFRIDAVVDKVSRKFAAEHTPAEIRATFAEETSRPKERGLAGIEPPNAKLADNVTHLYDICVPLGIDAGLPAERLVAVLEALPRVGMWKSKQRAKGLRIVADGLDWSYGEGPEVQGSADSLILAFGGRTQVLDDLEGEGVAVLRERLAGGPRRLGPRRLGRPTASGGRLSPRPSVTSTPPAGSASPGSSPEPILNRPASSFQRAPTGR